MNNLLVMVTGLVFCLNTTTPSYSSPFFTDARQQARGHTGVAAQWSANASRFNPASLADAPGSFQMRPLEATMTLGDNVIGTVGDIVSHDFSSNDSSNVVSFIRKFGDKFGDRQYVRAEILPLATRLSSFEVQPFLINSTYIEIRRPSIPRFDYEVVSSAGLQLSYGYSYKGKIGLGLALRPTYQNEQAGSLTFTDILDLENLESEEINQAASGFGVGADLAMTYSQSANLRYALKIQNVGGMGYLSSEGSPAVLKQYSSLGMSYRYVMRSWDINLLADIVGLDNYDGLHPIQLVNLGGELGRMIFTKDLDVGIAAGLHDGYGSYGLFVDLYLLRLSLGKFTEELARQPGVRPDTRVSLSLSTSFAF